MSTIISELQAKLVLDNSQFKQGLKQSAKSTSAFGSQIAKIGPMIAAAFSVTAIISFAKAASKAYDVQVKAERSLLTALKGRFDIQEALIVQAGQLQEITLFGDEETIQAQAVLASLGLEYDAIYKLIPLVQDLATMKGMRLTAAADLVSKSIGSSTNALSRYGIVIEGAVGSSERLETAIEGLNKQVGGQAEESAKVGMSAITQLSNSYGDLQEAIVGAATSSNGLNDILQLTSWIISNIATGIAVMTGNGEMLARMAMIAEGIVVKPIADVDEAQSKLLEFQNALIEAQEAGDETQIRRLNIRIKALKELIKIFESTTPSPTKATTPKSTKVPMTDVTVLGSVDALNQQKASLESLMNSVEFGTDVWVSYGISLDEVTEKLEHISALMNDGVSPSIMETNVQVQQLNDALSNMAAQGIAMAADAIGTMIGGGDAEDALAGFIDGIAGLLKGFGMLLISFGVSLAVLQESMNPYAMIAAGAALVIIGAAMSASLGDISNSAGGSSTATGGSYGGSYGGGGGYDNDTEIILVAKGDDLVAVLNRHNYRRSING